MGSVNSTQTRNEGRRPTTEAVNIIYINTYVENNLPHIGLPSSVNIGHFDLDYRSSYNGKLIIHGIWKLPWMLIRGPCLIFSISKRTPKRISIYVIESGCPIHSTGISIDMYGPCTYHDKVRYYNNKIVIDGTRSMTNTNMSFCIENGSNHPLICRIFKIVAEYEKEKPEPKLVDLTQLEEKDCPICCLSYSTDNMPVNLYRCKHLTCSECTEQLKQHTRCCPQCRSLFI